MDEAVADGVGQRRVADEVVPLRDGELTRQDRGAGAVAILEELEEVAAIVRAQGVEPPIVELCGAPHNSTYGEPAVMWSAAAPLEESLGFPQS